MRMKQNHVDFLCKMSKNHTHFCILYSKMRKNKKKLQKLKIILFHFSNINFKTFNDVSKNSSSLASLVFLISSILDEPTKHHVRDI